MDSVLDQQEVPRRAFLGTRMPSEGVKGPGRHVVHLAGRLDSGVAANIGTLTSHLADAGVGQTLLSLERSFGARDRVHDSVELLTVSTNRTGWLARWTSLRQRFRSLIEVPTVTDVHLHGVAAAWIGIRELRRQPRTVRVHVSLHSARSRGPMVRLAELACRASMMTGRSLRIDIIAADAAEARRFAAWRSRSVSIVEPEVAAEYFGAPRRESEVPLVLTDGRGQGNAALERFAQIAVLMSADHLPIDFRWLASTERDVPGARAAGIVALSCASRESVAAQLGKAWAYAECSTDNGTRDRLARAMAVGLPCIAWDHADSRDLIRHGVTGFLCKSNADVLQFMALLIDLPALRQQIGRAAKEEAERRFCARRVHAQMLEAYGLASETREDAIEAVEPKWASRAS